MRIVALVLMVLILIGVVAIAIWSVTIGNRQIIDFTNSFERAIICLPDGDVVVGKVTSWTDFEDGDQIQVKIDGKTYLVHSSNVVLISE